MLRTLKYLVRIGFKLCWCHVSRTLIMADYNLHQISVVDSVSGSALSKPRPTA